MIDSSLHYSPSLMFITLYQLSHLGSEELSRLRCQILKSGGWEPLSRLVQASKGCQQLAFSETSSISFQLWFAGDKDEDTHWWKCSCCCWFRLMSVFSFLVAFSIPIPVLALFPVTIVFIEKGREKVDIFNSQNSSFISTVKCWGEGGILATILSSQTFGSFVRRWSLLRIVRFRYPFCFSINH